MPERVSDIRHGRIDEVGDLEHLDMTQFNGGANPWDGNDFVDSGFRGGASHYRSHIERWGFANRGRVADIGSGFGRWTLFLGEVNNEAVGYERNEDAVNLSRKLADHLDFDNVGFEVADSASLPADANSFDGAWCFCTLHILHRGNALSEMNRILKPGGVLFLGHFNGAGRVLTKFFKSYQEGGMAHHRTRNAVRALQQGPSFNGKGNYATIESVGATLQEFGFRLLDDPPLDVELYKTPDPALPFREHLQDLRSLGQRLEQDQAFATEFAKWPQLAYFFPKNLNLCAVKQ